MGLFGRRKKGGQGLVEPYNPYLDEPAPRDNFHHGTGYGPYDPRPLPQNWPIDGYQDNSALRSSPFGSRESDGYHPGMDFAVPEGTPVKATMDGTVMVAEKSKKGYGIRIVIKHGDRHYSTFGHLSQLNVKKGDKIKAGTVIGLSGNTGNSTGPHLHYEISEDGYYKGSRRFDPEEWHNRKNK